MLLLAFLLLPMALTMGKRIKTGDYVITINDNNYLTNVRMVGNGSDDLDLSSFGLRAVGPRVFEHLSNLKTLNLAKNSIRTLPELLMANLTNLEHLNLAKTDLYDGQIYSSLSNLKTLNISNTTMFAFLPCFFFGLTKSTNILMQGLKLWFINAAMFEDCLNLTSRPPLDVVEDRTIKIMSLNAQCNNTSDVSVISELPHWNIESLFKICIQDGQLKSLENFKEGDTLQKNCRDLKVDFDTLRLNRLGITKFGKRWYRLQDPNVKVLNLEFNRIVEITKEMLNNLPPGIGQVILRGNKINRLKRGIIKNANPIELLDLCRNNISEIEVGALEDLNLPGMLFLCNNRLNNTKFLDSLPSNIHGVSLGANHITEISAGNFSKFTCFLYLGLNYNNITEAKAGQLQGFSSLLILELSHNHLRMIEPDFFQDLNNLMVLRLEFNDISRLGNSFTELPASLRSLYLGNNRIGSLSAGTFVNAPTGKLALNGNQMSKIEKGSFNLPHLQELDLQNNSLKEIDGDSFEGLMNLDRLSLASNVITTIKKGAAKNLNHLSILDLSYNQIKIFENGALFGLPKTMEFRIKLFGVSVEIIQGGLFDDV